MRISDWSSDVCSSDLQKVDRRRCQTREAGADRSGDGELLSSKGAVVVPGVLGQPVDGCPDEDARQRPPERELGQPSEPLLDEPSARHPGGIGIRTEESRVGKE